MKHIDIKPGQVLQIRTINGTITIEQTYQRNAPAQVLFYFTTLEQDTSSVYELPLVGLPAFCETAPKDSTDRPAWRTA
jgi:hypothetical protein